MTFLYTTDRSGKIVGFAALRKVGAHNGYHVDPFIQTPDAPRGVSDLLIYASLAMLRTEGCTFLSLGFEPMAAVGEINGMPAALHSTTRKIYAHVFGRIPVGGKEAFFARWKPDITQEEAQYLVFATKLPSPRYMLAMTHFANISLRQIIASDIRALLARSAKKQTAITGTNPDDAAVVPPMPAIPAQFTTK